MTTVADLVEAAATSVFTVEIIWRAVEMIDQAKMILVKWCQKWRLALHSLWYHHTYRCDDTRGCVMQFWPPDDEHICSKHVEAWNKLTVKQKFCASNLLITQIKTLHVSDSSSVHHQQFFTIHTATVYVIRVCWQHASRIRTEPVPSWSCSQAVWHIPLLCVQWTNSWWWTEELSETCRVLFQKYISEINASSWFYYKELMHLVGYIIRN